MFAFGIYVAVGIAGNAEGISWFGSGFGMFMRAMLTGAGVAGVAQLERINVQMIRRKIHCGRW